MKWEPLFEDLASHGFAFEELNDLSRGTYPVPGFPIEARLDWIVARGMGVAEGRCFAGGDPGALLGALRAAGVGSSCSACLFGGRTPRDYRQSNGGLTAVGLAT